MRSIPRPTTACATVYADCVRAVRNTELRERLTRIAPSILRADQEFTTLAQALEFYRFPLCPGLPPDATKEELQSLYSRLVDNEDARVHYNAILNSCPFGRCPLCGYGSALTIDHYLPQSRYANLTVIPNNLVPACRDCQSRKSNFAPTIADEQLLHPYFDRIDDEQWLFASVVQAPKLAVDFRVSPPAGWNSTLIARVQRHFQRFGLRSLYSQLAGSELAGIQRELSDLHVAGGAGLVASNLVRRAESKESQHRNSWQGALYRACAQSNWYCDGGFKV